jgi:diguanylate cyclase (GGDEF)-like protein
MVRDPLTGAYSQGELKTRLREEVVRAAKEGKPLSLLFMDIDHFKSINDGFGHLRGDEVLREFAERAQSTIREDDLFFRYGGDEFLLISPDTTKDQALTLADRLLEGVGSTPFKGDPPLSISASIGVVSCPEDGRSAEELFGEADQRLYEAKRAGRGQVVAQSPAKGISLPFDEASRLVERDEALRKVQDFLKQVGEKKRGVLAVTGPRGSGRSRFLAEIARAAGLQGCEVIRLEGNPATKLRPGFALAQALQASDESPLTSLAKGKLTKALEGLLSKKKVERLLFAIDNIAELDSATLGILSRFAASSDIPIIGLSYTVPPETSRRLFFQTHLWEVVQLAPLSEKGLRVWLRSLLGWEPPSEFTRWLHSQTGGLPAFLRKGLTWLVNRGVLRRGDDKWLLSQDFSEIPLAEKVGVKREYVGHNLPMALTSFVGREGEIEETKRLLAENRLVTILGPGGIGKTRLVVQSAAEILNRFPDGVRFCALASLRSADLLIPAIADAFDFSFYGSKEPKSQLFAFLGEKEALILLDSFEHLVEDAGLVSQILKEAPKLRLLVTSRERLAIQGEVILELGGMDFPSEDVPGDIETYSAVQLFIEGARRLDPGLVISKKDQPFLARISRMVEGIPLGIELAASWVRSLSLVEIAEEIERGYDFLATSLRDVPERHRSLKLVFDYSWKLLDDKEKEAFRRLSVFRGGFSRQAAQKVAGAPLPVLSTLIDKSMLSRNQAGRYQMLEVLRRYAGEKLSEDEEVYRRTKDLHAAYQGEALHQREEDLNTARQKEALEEIREELENVRAGFRWSVERKNMEMLENYLEPLSLFYEHQGRFAEGKELFAWADEQLRDTKGLVPAKVRALSGAFLQRLGFFPQARVLIETSLPLFRELGAKREEALALNVMGNVAYRAGEYDEAQKLYTENLEICRRISDQVGIATALSRLGGVANTQGRYEEARAKGEESLAVLRKINNHRGLARTLNNLGNTLLAMGAYDEANRCYAESLDISRELGHKWGIGIVLGNMSEAALYRKEYERARGFLSEAFDISREIGDREGMVFCLNHMGDVAFALGDWVQARRFHEQGLEISMGMDNPLEKSSSLKGLGRVACALGRYEEAEGYFRDALELATKIKRVMAEADILVETAQLFAKKDEPRRALELLAVVIANPGAEKETRDKADTLLAELESKLPAEEFEAAVEKGKARKFEEVVENILKEQ